MWILRLKGLSIHENGNRNVLQNGDFSALREDGRSFFENEYVTVLDTNKCACFPSKMTPFSVFIAFSGGRAQTIQKRNLIILKTEKKNLRF